MFDWLEYLSGVFIFETLGLDKQTQIGEAANFFLYDTIKIFILLIGIIFIVSFLRTYFNTEKVRVYLQGKSEFSGNVLASLFGIIDPLNLRSNFPLEYSYIPTPDCLKRKLHMNELKVPEQTCGRRIPPL